jgi:RNA polymerase sigma factor (sigma-70 family)
MAESQSSSPPCTSHASGALDGQSTVPTPADEHALFVRQLFERYRHALMRYLWGLLKRRADAEDVVQETYMRLLSVADLDRSGSRARAYLFKVATNLARDRFRRRAEQGAGTELVEEDFASSDDSPELIVDFAQGLAIVKRTLLDLKPRCRQVFLLRVSEELDYETIAARLGVSKRTVEREMQHALEVCQKRLERSGQ